MRIQLFSVLLGLASVPAMANIAESSGAEVSCEFNASYVKKSDDNGSKRPKLDVRISSLPLLKLSGKSAVLNPSSHLHCRNFYEGQLDENTLISACSNNKEGEPLNVEKISFVLLNPPERMTKFYFCQSKKATKKETSDAGIK